MKKEIIESLLDDFDWYKNETEDGIEFWFARDLQHLLWYTEWRSFKKVINKAKTTCETIWEEIRKNSNISITIFLNNIYHACWVF